MFGERLDGHITMLQRLVALLRDLILGVTLALTCLIVYFGGDSSKLNVLDWTKLIGAASLIVVGPIFAILIVKGLVNMVRFSFCPHYYFLDEARLPKGLWVCLFLRVGKKSKREYATFWRQGKFKVQRISTLQPKLLRFYRRFVRFGFIFENILTGWYLYILTIMSLVLAILVFKDIVQTYIP
jgi:hypothetical protein